MSGRSTSDCDVVSTWALVANSGWWPVFGVDLEIVVVVCLCVHVDIVAALLY